MIAIEYWNAPMTRATPLRPGMKAGDPRARVSPKPVADDVPSPHAATLEFEVTASACVKPADICTTSVNPGTNTGDFRGKVSPNPSS
jgi:hypothetical protein